MNTMPTAQSAVAAMTDECESFSRNFLTAEIELASLRNRMSSNPASGALAQRTSTPNYEFLDRDFGEAEVELAALRDQRQTAAVAASLTRPSTSPSVSLVPLSPTPVAIEWLLSGKDTANADASNDRDYTVAANEYSMLQRAATDAAGDRHYGIAYREQRVFHHQVNGLGWLDAAGDRDYFRAEAEFEMHRNRNRLLGGTSSRDDRIKHDADPQIDRDYKQAAADYRQLNGKEEQSPLINRLTACTSPTSSPMASVQMDGQQTVPPVVVSFPLSNVPCLAKV